MKQGASVADRKKALKAWQIKWHPDKNPDQLEVVGLRMLMSFHSRHLNYASVHVSNYILPL